MSACFKEIDQPKLRRQVGESFYAFAVRLYRAQMNGYASLAFGDFYILSFEDMDRESREKWIEKAKRREAERT